MRMRALALVLSGAALLGACSGSGDEATKARDTEAQDATAETATDVAAETAGFCEQFEALAAQREQRGGGGVRPGSDEAAPDDAEGWERRIETTTSLADSAPAEYQADAQTYVELVEARAALFASHGYPASLDEIPEADVQAFIAEHADEQQAANRLIDFAKTECGVA